MADSPQPKSNWLKRLSVPIVMILLAGALIFLISGRWNVWASSGEEQTTDDAYLRADLTPLSTKAAGLKWPTTSQ
jgi:membrane fusion protein (multidrug efflux system)